MTFPNNQNQQQAPALAIPSPGQVMQQHQQMQGQVPQTNPQPSSMQAIQSPQVGSGQNMQPPAPAAPVQTVTPGQMQLIPPVQNQGGFTPSPEQMVTAAQMQTQQAGLTAPAGAQPTINIHGQAMGGQPQQTQLPQQPAPQGQEYGVDAGQFQGVDEGLLQDLVDQAYQQKVPHSELGGYVQNNLEQMSRFENQEHYQAYEQAFNKTFADMAKSYGGEQGAQAAMDRARENILAHGGEALLQRFSTDPSMLTPETLGPYLKETANSNPYDQYAKPTGGYQQYQTGQQPPGQPQFQGAPQGGTPMGGFGGQQVRNSAEIQQEISNMYNTALLPMDMPQSSPKWGQRMSALMSERRAAMAQGR